MKLSPQEKKILSFIKEYVFLHGHAPYLKEIQKKFGYKSLTSVQRLIYSLQKKRIIKKSWNRKRGIKVNSTAPQMVNVPIVGVIAAGTPIIAFENIEGYIQTDKHFVRGSASNFFYLQAQGDSMNAAGIDDGDFLLIHSQTSAENGDVVVALIDDSATVKVIKKERGLVKLEPRSTNPVHKPILLRENFRIQGKVTKVIKS